MLLARLLAAALVVGLAGCPDPSAPACALPATTTAADFVLVYVTAAGELHDATDGAQVPIQHAPQGGFILLAGARVHGAGDCMIAATAALRDPATNRVIGLESRPLLLEAASNGWASPRDPSGLSSMPNIAVCPSSAATTAINDHPYRLELALTDAAGASLAMLSATITPTCPAGDTYCASSCAPPL